LQNEVQNVESSIIVTLSTGKKVTVYPVPPYDLELSLAKIKKPEPPRRKLDPKAVIPGVTDNYTLPDEENPEYKEALDTWAQARLKVFNDARLLYGLRDERPPEDWPTEHDQERWAFLGMEVDLSTRLNRQLAWIKHGVLTSGADTELVFAAMGSFDELKQEEVQTLLDSFRPQSKRDTLQ